MQFRIKPTVVCLLVAFALAFAVPAGAQFGLPGKKKEETSGGGASLADVEVQQEKLVKDFVAAQQNLLTAQSLVADALGLKEEKEKLDAEREALGKGNVDKEDLERSNRITKNAIAAIQKTTDAADLLSDDAKATLAKSMVPYAKSVVGVAGMVGEAKNLASGIQAQIKSAGMMGAMKVKKTFDVGLYLAPKIPGFSAGMLQQLGTVVSFAKKNGVKIPKEATDLI